MAPHRQNAGTEEDELRSLTDDDVKTITEMLDAAIRHFRKHRAQEKRPFDPATVYYGFMDEIQDRLNLMSEPQ